MPTLEGGLFSLSASGTLNKEVVYYKVRGQQRSRGYAIPIQPNTPAQMNERDLFRSAMISWGQTNSTTKNIWNEYSKVLDHPGRSGYNWYISKCLYYLAESSGVLPDQPFLPDTIFVPPIIHKVHGSLIGDISILGDSGSTIVIKNHNTQTIIETIVLSNNQSSFQSSELGSIIADIEINPGSLLSVIPGSILNLDITQPSNYDIGNIEYTILPQTVTLSGGISGDTNMLGDFSCSLDLVTYPELEPVAHIDLINNQTSYQFEDVAAGTYSIQANKGSMNSVDPTIYNNIEVIPPTDLSGYDFQFVI